MKKSEAGIKAELMKEAEKQIDELLSWGREKAAPNLREIETKVQEVRERLSLQMTEALIGQQEQVQPAIAPKCESCHKAMSYKGRQVLQVTSWVGEVEVERGYYYCATCKGGFFPLG